VRSSLTSAEITAFLGVTQRYGISKFTQLALPDDPTRYAGWPL
jgi:hypothetical protein